MNNNSLGLRFKDEEHQEYFYKFMSMANARPTDPERVSLFYLLSIFAETRAHINHLYDFENGWIERDGLNKGWQTSGTTKVCRLAFNLYNGFRGEDGENENYSPLHLFSVADEYRNYMLYAVQLRFNL